MRGVVYEELSVSNFKCFVGEPVVVRLDSGGLSYIRGENKSNERLGANGVGKSTIFEALCWCLYGKTSEGLRNPDIKPWEAEAGTPEVSVKLRVNDKSHTVTRSTKTNGLWLDDKETSQDVIDDLVGYNFTIATATTLLGQGRPLFLDLSPSDQIKLFINTLDLERWDRRSDTAKRWQNELQVVLDKAINEREGSLIAYDDLKDLHRSNTTSHTLWADEWRRRQRDMRDEKSRVRQELDEAQRKLDAASLKEDSAGVEWESCDREVRKLEEELRQQMILYDRSADKLDSIAAKIDELEGELERLQVADVCPTCGQPISSKDVKGHRKELESKLDALRLEHAKGVPEKLVNAVALTKKRLEENQSYRSSFKAALDAAKREHAALAPAVHELIARWRELNKDMKDEINPYTAVLSELSEKIKEIEKNIHKLEATITSSGRELERAKFWVKGFKDIKLSLLDEIIQELELVTNGMLEEVGLGDWQIRFALEKETRAGDIRRALNVQISSPESRGLVKWEVWSFGERQRLRLIGALAFADVLLSHAGVDPNIEVLDEPTQHLSTAGVHDTCELLAQRARVKNRTVFFISHETVESNLFSNVMVVVKDRNGSYIR